MDERPSPKKHQRWVVQGQRKNKEGCGGEDDCEKKNVGDDLVDRGHGLDSDSR